jgi:hypothetical protein
MLDIGLSLQNVQHARIAIFDKEKQYWIESAMVEEWIAYSESALILVFPSLLMLLTLSI